MKKILSVLSVLAVLSTVAITAFAATDTTSPTDVTGLKAVAGDAQVSLSWDVATDNVGIGGYSLYYGLTPAKTAADKWTFGKTDVGNVVKYDVKNLKNGITYYFAVIAYDTATPVNKSASYSNQVFATPVAGLGLESDTVAPTVVKAEAISKSEVKVEFSEKVQLSKAVEQAPEQAFTIEDDDTIESLEVLDAKVVELKDMEEADVLAGKEGKLVLLTTETQKKDAKYVLTAKIDIEDLAKNPIVSGTSDTAPFTGSDKEPKDKDVTPPEMLKVSANDTTTLLIKFNESIVLGLEPAKQFTIYLSGTNKEGALEVKSVLLGDDTEVDPVTGSLSDGKDTQVLLTVAEMQKDKTYMLEVTDVQDVVGNKISTDKNTIEFKVEAAVVSVDTDQDGTDGTDGVDGVDGSGETPATLVDAEKFVAKLVKKDETLSVVLSWTLPIGEVSKLQKMYRSADSGVTYGDEAELTKDAKAYTADKNLKVGDTLWFKLTQVDGAGTESKGVIAKVKLTETGPELIGLVLVSLGLGRVFGKKRK